MQNNACMLYKGKCKQQVLFMVYNEEVNQENDQRKH